MKPTPLDLYSAFLDGVELSDEDAAALSRWLAEDPAHAEEAVRLVFLHEALDSRLGLTRMLQGMSLSAVPDDDVCDRRAGGDVSQDTGNESAPVHVSGNVRGRAAASHQPALRRVPWLSPTSGWAAVAATAFAALTLYLFTIGDRQQHPIAQHKVAPPSGPAPVAPAQPVVDATPPIDAASESSDDMFVGRIIRVSDNAAWADDAGPTEFLLRISHGERLELLAGFAEIEFNNGVRLILQGHTDYTFTNVESGELHFGSVTGLAEAGNYRVATPSADVLDLGTEFGVSVDRDANTEVMVFEGEVRVSSKNRGGLTDVVHLDRGDAAHVDVLGHVQARAELAAERFARALPAGAVRASRPSIVSLVDIVTGGDGTQGRLAAGLNPLTCEIDQRKWRDKKSPGDTPADGQYHRSSYHPAIDGSFIVPATGLGVQLDSQGHTTDAFGANEGAAWGPIWARRLTTGLPPATGDFWGTGTLVAIITRLQSAELGGLGMHPNVGMTFDLHKIAKRDAASFASFCTTVVNLDFADKQGQWRQDKVPVRTASFWVFVDGQLRYCRREFGRDIVGQPIEVPLNEGDRFLTLVTTDGGNENSYDHVMLVDPVLILDAQGEGP